MNEEQVQRTIKSIRALTNGPRREPSAQALARAGLRGRRGPSTGTQHRADAVLERLHGSSKGKGRSQPKG